MNLQQKLNLRDLIKTGSSDPIADDISILKYFMVSEPFAAASESTMTLNIFDNDERLKDGLFSARLEEAQDDNGTLGFQLPKPACA